MQLNIARKTTRTGCDRADRVTMALPGRITWKDSRGMMRFASVVTRDISDTGVFIEWSESTSIPLYRLVTFQLERDARQIDGIPSQLRNGKVLSAVYRAGTFRKSTGTPDGYGLRLLIEPAVQMHVSEDRVQATA